MAHMYYVYVLQCADGRLYTGYSANLKERLRAHKNGEVFVTKGLRPVSLIFYEAFIHQQDAKRREKYLQTTAGKKALKLMLRRYLADRKQSRGSSRPK